MDGASAVGQSIEAANQVLKTAQTAEIELSKKMIKAGHEQRLGVEAGKGQMLDMVG